MFERKNDYYFLTLSGKIYIAPSVFVDSKKIERLIDELDSDTFSVREKATLELRAIGKPAHRLLETHLSKSVSPEQRRRIAELLDRIKVLTDRETKLLWGDENRPVDKLLCDMDKNKVYAFTKPNRGKQVYFFEITDEPQPQPLTGKSALETPASVPLSTRLFMEYARFVRSSK